MLEFDTSVVSLRPEFKLGYLLREKCNEIDMISIRKRKRAEMAEMTEIT